MKKVFLLQWVMLFFLGVVLLPSCQKNIQAPQQMEPAGVSSAEKSDQGEKTNVFKGPEVPLGNGYVRTWIRMNHLDQPLEIGVEFTAGALTGLPAEIEPGEEGPDHTTLVLPLHLKAKQVTPFDHVGLNWNPHGHPPPFLFMVPHFDIHFYMMSNEERMMIPAYAPGSAFDIFPPAGYMPGNYFPGPGGEIQMGKHWSMAPDQIAPFTRTMILGTYNGAFKFVEPMVTYDFLNSGVPSSLPYSQPAKFAVAGNYPTLYNIYTGEAGSHHVTLSGFVPRQAE